MFYKTDAYYNISDFVIIFVKKYISKLDRMINFYIFINYYYLNNKNLK